MHEDGDQSDLREGVTPEATGLLRQRRVRKLAGPTREALGELAFVLYSVCDLAVPDTRKWDMLKAKLLAWRGRYV